MEIPAHLLDSISVSSTRIREAIGRGDMDTAKQLLGYTYFFSGEVTEGNHLGRTIGYPTANLVDRGKIQTDSRRRRICCGCLFSDEPETRYMGMMNIGYRPTVDGIKKND